MQLIDVKAYQNAREKRQKVMDSLPFEPSSDSATENAGRNGINLQEISADINGVQPDDIWDEKEPVDNTDASSAINTLLELSDFLDSKGEKVYADFTDMLIKKIAKEKSKTPVERFNDLMIKINNTDIPETNETLKKLAKIFSRTVMIEMTNHGDLEKAQESAYQKVLHRADQFLSGGSMINKSASIYENPRIVAEYIKGIIDVLVARFSQDARMRAYPNLRNKIMQLNPSELASKKSPGGAAIGVALSLVKNILNGRDPHFINLVMTNLARIL